MTGKPKYIYSGSTLRVQNRFRRVAKIFFKIFIDFSREYRLVRIQGYHEAIRKMKPVHERRARELYAAAASMGGVLIKLCQYFSARRDVFPEEYVRILTPLQDSVPPVPFEEIETVIRDEYGDSGKYFASIDSKPLASASLGQTHRARLHDGREAVLKILKPGIERIIDIDFAILHFVFKLMSHFRVFREHADFIDLLSEFIRVTGDELNFRREIHIAKKFRKDLARFSYIRVPEIFEECSTRRIIVMEYCEGDRINKVDDWIGRGNDPLIISKRIVEIYVEQFLSMSFIHFDPHPGNILVSDDNRMALLDFGMAGEISDGMRRGLADFLNALIERNSRSIIDILFRMGFIRKRANRYSLLPVVDFFMNELLETIKLDRESYYNVDFSPIRDDLAVMIYSQPLTVPIEWAYIGKTVSSLGGLVSQLNPEFNIYGELKPYAGRLVAGGIAETASRLFDSFKKNITISAALPLRVSNFMEEIEGGYFRMKVDYTEMRDKIDEVQAFVVRLISFVLVAVSAVSCFIFYLDRKYPVAAMFAAIGSFSLVWFLFYRRKTMRDRIKKYF